MTDSLIGTIIRYEGQIYQILSVRGNMLTAHSYGKDNGISQTIFASKTTGKVVAMKATTRQKCNTNKHLV